VENEMKWTLAWISYQEKNWENRSKDANDKKLDGHRCYAEKQLIVWRTMKKQFYDDWSNIV
jgi:hypothetical protein